MSRIPNNSTLLSFAHVQHGTRYYVNQYGQQVRERILIPSVRLQEIGSGLARPHPEYPGESELVRAERLGLLDMWKMVVVFQLSANHSITYTGERAATMWKAWSTYIFNKQ